MFFMGSWLSSPFPFKKFFIFKTSFSAFTAYRGRGLVNLQCRQLKSEDVSTRVVEENFRNVTSRDKEFGKFPKSTFACPCAYVHNFIPLHWKCKDIYLCRQRKLKQVSLSYSPAQRRTGYRWVARRVWIPLQNLRSPYLWALVSIMSYGDRT